MADSVSGITVIALTQDLVRKRSDEGSPSYEKTIAPGLAAIIAAAKHLPRALMSPFEVWKPGAAAAVVAAGPFNSELVQNPTGFVLE